jgi:hypothetical protein
MTAQFLLGGEIENRFLLKREHWIDPVTSIFGLVSAFAIAISVLAQNPAY